MTDFDSLVGQFMDITSFREDAIVRKALRDNNNNLPMIINEYFNGPDNFIQRYELKWDHSAWSTNREGEPTNTHVIHADDTNTNEVIYGTEPSIPYAGLAPSRPPSRTDNRSPLSRVVDLQAPNYNMTGAPMTQQEEDDALARAIEMSMHESQDGGGFADSAFPALPQESGVTGGTFGPATRDESAYAKDQWALIPTTQFQTGPPDPTLRARKPGDPVFLRAKGSSHRLGALLMIYHQIPAARNALLQTARPNITTYGRHRTWWDGSLIVPEGKECPTWEDEVCRLMAFLDESERSYGTIDALAGAAAMINDDPEKDFFHQLAKELETQQKPDHAFISDVEVINPESKSIHLFDRFGLLELSYMEETQPHNLYNIWDLVFYADLAQTAQTPSDGRLAWISRPSDVITCRIQYGNKLHSKFEIPEVFYLDRYLKSRQNELLDIQEDMIKAYCAYEDYKRKDYQILNWTSQAGVAVDRKKLLAQALEKLEIKARRITNAAYWKQHMAAQERGEVVPEYLPTPHETLEPHHEVNEGQAILGEDEQAALNHLQGQIDDLKSQVDKVTKHKDEAKQRIEAFEKLFAKLRTYLTEPECESEKWRPRHKYILCGVVNNSNTVYLRSLGEEGDGTAPAEYKWKKISCHVNFGEFRLVSVSHEDVKFEDVLKDACGPQHSPTLVYATEEALLASPIPLDEKQKMFVKTDNEYFQEEIAAASGPRMAEPVFGGGVGGGFHRARTSSLDSLATNKASVGSVDGGHDSMDLDDFSGGGSEMEQISGVPMITISPPATPATGTDPSPPPGLA
ncbi:hypothetical protein QBC38DRAFT_501254 [Podospora fimiseda]|uniref:Ubiquitin interaction motif protein n=1 Tax=Podospora fimiseda TaxID=252190 RepID=A0AAN7BLF9_9PEZI|nr:hypothetical protein QBC38DRAFT_501254 [Podospora fimiseda]